MSFPWKTWWKSSHHPSRKALHIHSPTQHRTALPTYKQSKVKTQNRYFILYLNSCKKGPDKSHSSFVGFYFHTFSCNGFTVFSHQFTFHTALKKTHNTAHHGKSLPGFVAFYGFLYFMSAGIFCCLFFVVGVEFISKSDFKRKLSPHERE